MPPAGYPAFLQYLQSGRVSGIHVETSALAGRGGPGVDLGLDDLGGGRPRRNACQRSSHSAAERLTVPPPS